MVDIYDLRIVSGQVCLIMEFVQGPSALDRLKDGPLPIRDVLRIGEDVAMALQAAFEVGVIHRDVKPSNILLRKDGRAVVADFGLAKADADPALSITGDTIGTPWYMSPEQALTIEAKVDQRTDVYSLGVTFYEALSGRRPFDGKTALAVLEAIKSAVPEALERISPECTPEAESVCRRAMARLPENRYARVAEMRDDFMRLAVGQGTQARADEGGPLRRAFTAVQSAGVGYQPRGREYKSAGTLLGLPLYHVYTGSRGRGEGVRIARGWLAIGDVAIGGVTFGGLSLGVFSMGGTAVGLGTAVGGIAVGGAFATGGMAAGGTAFGGMALGWLAFGGFALGYYALGGIAWGQYAWGGNPRGAPIDFGPDGTFAEYWFYEWGTTLVELVSSVFGSGAV